MNTLMLSGHDGKSPAGAVRALPWAQPGLGGGREGVQP